MKEKLTKASQLPGHLLLPQDLKDGLRKRKMNFEKTKGGQKQDKGKC